MCQDILLLLFFLEFSKCLGEGNTFLIISRQYFLNNFSKQLPFMLYQTTGPKGMHIDCT